MMSNILVQCSEQVKYTIPLVLVLITTLLTEVVYSIA